MGNDVVFLASADLVSVAPFRANYHEGDLNPRLAPGVIHIQSHT